MKHDNIQAIAFMFKRIDFWSTMRYLSAMHYGMAIKTNDKDNKQRWDRIAEFCSKRYHKSRYDLDWYIKMNVID